MELKNLSFNQIKRNKKLVKKIIEETNYLPENINLSQRIYHIKNNLKKIPKCPICGNDLHYINLNLGYTKTCSKKCGAKLSKEKVKKTNLKKYGVEYIFQSKQIKNKIKKTNLKKYGVENVFASEEIKNKIKKTNLKKYGVKYPIQSEKIKDKFKKIILEKYGTEYIFQSEKIKNKIKKTNLEKYGAKYPIQSEQIKDKIKKTNLKKYGVENVFSSEQIKNKIKKTNLEKYGAKYPIQSKQIRNKIKKTMLKKYNVEYPIQSKQIKNKIKKTNLKKYYFNLFNRLNDIVEPLFDLEEYKGCKQNGKNLKYKFKCKKCGNIFEDTLANGKIPICRKCFPKITGTSHYEDELENWLKKYKIKIIRNKKFDNKYELDLYLPKYNFGIEFNGLYWHSNIYKNKNYHKNKTEYFFKKNIKVFHVFEDEWMFKQNIIKSMILAKLNIFDKKIYARNCKIKEIDSKLAKSFLEQNHLDGYINSKYNLGLFYNNKLVMVSTFGRHRFKKDEKLELYRIATKLNHQVIGGFSRLLSFYKKQGFKIITYIDRRFGGIYNAKTTNPNLWYTDFEQKYNRMKFQKYKLKNIFDNYNPNLTANQNLELNGIYPIYGVGNYILEF